MTPVDVALMVSTCDKKNLTRKFFIFQLFCNTTNSNLQNLITLIKYFLYEKEDNRFEISLRGKIHFGVR